MNKNIWKTKHSDEFGEYIKQTIDPHIFCFNDELELIHKQDHVFTIQKNTINFYELKVLIANDNLSLLEMINKEVLFHINETIITNDDTNSWIFLKTLHEDFDYSLMQAKKIINNLGFYNFYIPNLIKEYPTDLGLEFEKWFMES